jgi:aminopeptidase N
MMHTLVGREGFARGMKLYFQRHDGQAVTCDHFAQAIADANPASALSAHLDLFKRWYAQAGTPRQRADATTHPHTLHAHHAHGVRPGSPGCRTDPDALACWRDGWRSFATRGRGHRAVPGPVLTKAKLLHSPMSIEPVPCCFRFGTGGPGRSVRRRPYLANSTATITRWAPGRAGDEPPADGRAGDPRDHDAPSSTPCARAAPPAGRRLQNWCSSRPRKPRRRAKGRPQRIHAVHEAMLPSSPLRGD